MGMCGRVRTKVQVPRGAVVTQGWPGTRKFDLACATSARAHLAQPLCVVAGLLEAFDDGGRVLLEVSHPARRGRYYSTAQAASTAQRGAAGVCVATDGGRVFPSPAS